MKKAAGQDPAALFGWDDVFEIGAVCCRYRALGMRRDPLSAVTPQKVRSAAEPASRSFDLLAVRAARRGAGSGAGAAKLMPCGEPFVKL